MAEDRIDSYVDLSAVGRETQLFAEMLAEIEAKFDKLNGIKLSLDGLTKTKDVATTAKKAATAVDELTLSTQEYNNILSATARGNAKLAASESEAAKELQKTRQAQQERNRELKNQVTLETAAEGSINQLRAQLRQLNATYDALSAAERNAAGGKELLDKINQIDAAVKGLEFGSGRFQRNVGNYPGAAKIIVEALEKAKQKTEAFTVSLGDMHPATIAARKEFDGLRTVTEHPGFMNLAAGAGDASREFKTLTKSLIEMERQGLGNTEVAIQLRGQLASLQDQMSDTRAEIKALSSDTRSFDLFAGAVNFLADTFQTAAGAIGLAADNEKEIQAITKNLIAITAISNGMKGIANELTTRGTAANKAYAFIQGQVAIVTDASAKATSRLGAAFKLLGIGLIVGAIALLVTNFSKLKSMLSGLSREQQLNNEINEKALDGYIKEKVQVEALAREVQKETTSKERKKEIIAELNELSPTYFGNIKTEKDLQDKLTDSVTKYIKALELKARAEVAYEKLIEAERPIVQRQIKLQQDLEQARTATFDSEERRQRTLAGLQKTITEGTDKQLLALQKQVAPIRKVVEDINAELDVLGGDPKDGKRQQALDDLFAAQQNAIRNAAELDKDAQQRRLAQIKKDFEDRKVSEFKFLQESKERLKQSLQDELTIINSNLAEQLKSAGDSEGKKKIAQDNAHKERVLAERNYHDQVLALEEEAAKRRKKIVSTTIQDILELQSTSLSKMAQDLSKISGNSIADRLGEFVTQFREARQAITEELKALRKEVGLLALDTFATLVSGSFDNAKNELQEQINLIEEKKQKEIEAANATITNEQDKAAAITVIEARAQAQRQVLERRQKQLDIQKAKFEKAAAVMRVAIDTFQKVAAIKAQAALLLANPATAILAPLALAQIPLVIAGGALATAGILAQPIPKFKYGRQFGKATWGITGDGGKHEVITSPDMKQATVTPATDTLTFLPHNYKVFPDINSFLDAANHIWMKPVAGGDRGSNADVISEYRKGTKAIVSTIKNKREVHVKGSHGGVMMLIKHGYNHIEYVDKNVNF